MNTEIDTVNEIIAGEIEAAASAAASRKPSDAELMEEALSLYHDERTLEHWRVMFFNEQLARIGLENELHQKQRKYRSVSAALRRAKFQFEAVKYHAQVLDHYLATELTVSRDTGVLYHVVKVSLELLRNVMMRIDIPDISDCDIDDIPF